MSFYRNSSEDIYPTVAPKTIVVAQIIGSASGSSLNIRIAIGKRTSNDVSIPFNQEIEEIDVLGIKIPRISQNRNADSVNVIFSFLIIIGITSIVAAARPIISEINRLDMGGLPVVKY